MTLIEVIVALGLFALMSTAVLGVLGSAIKATREDKARLEAISLASRELEIVRDTFASVLRGPDQVADAVNPNKLVGQPDGPIVVDGVPYTVVRETRWEAVGDGVTSPCDDGTSEELAYLHVTVKVTWPDLGDRPPVTMDTLMTPPKGTYSSLQTQSFIGIKVIDGDGQPKAGVRITATKSDGQVATPELTASDGCALLENLAPGDWTVTAANPGYVNPAGDPTAMKTVHLEAGRIWRGTIEYDQAAQVAASFAAPDGYQLPAGADTLPVAIGNSGLQPTGARVFATTGALAAATLWPYPSGYEVWAGGCQDGSPTVTGVSNLATVYPVSPGVPVTRTVTFGAIDVYVAPGAHVTAVHLPEAPSTTPDPLCPDGLEVELGDADATGLLKTSLPYGAWAIVSGSGRLEVAVTATGTRAELVAPPEPEATATATPTDAPTEIPPLTVSPLPTQGATP